MKLSTPKELGGGGGPGNNPEQLFASGYAACFIGAMKFVASQGGPKVPANATVAATVGIGPRSEGGFGLDIALDISLPGLPNAEAQALVEKAHQVCPYSNATRNNVPVRLNLCDTGLTVYEHIPLPQGEGRDHSAAFTLVCTTFGCMMQ